MRNIFIFLLFSIFLISCDQLTDVIANDDIQIQDESLETDSNKELEQKQASKELLEQLTVHYIDAGQGDATLFQFSDGDESYTILYDVGDWQGNEVVTYLQQEQINFIDLIIISHPHADHMGQLEKVINHFDVGEVWMSGNMTSTTVFQSAMEAVLDNDIDYDEPRAGDVFDIGSLELSVLHPEQLTGGLNEDSLSIRFKYGNVSFLFTGDAYANEEQLMLQRTAEINADFLHLGHHGSNTSSDPQFIDAVQPEYAIYSAGAGNSYGHPHEEVVRLLQKKEIPLYGTDVNGTITVTTDGVKATLATEKESAGNEPNHETKEQKEKKVSNCIDINNASKDKLEQIIHIGEARADELIDGRPFTSLDDLSKINGIGAARIVDIKDEGKACIGGK